MGAQSPIVVFGFITSSLHARAIRAPAEMALFSTKAIVLPPGSFKSVSTICRAESTRPPKVSISRTKTASGYCAASLNALLINAAIPGSTSPDTGITHTFWPDVSPDTPLFPVIAAITTRRRAQRITDFPCLALNLISGI